MQNGGFTIVTKRSRKMQSRAVTFNDLPAGLDSKLCYYQQVIKSSKLFKSIKKRPISSQVVCYGLGPLHLLASQVQLAMLLLLTPAHNISFYDPILNPKEVAFLMSLGMIQEEAIDCFKVVIVPTLFYMIHCPHSLYNNILKSNSLSNIQIIGNSIEIISKEMLRLPDFEISNVFSDTYLYIPSAPEDE